MLLKIPSAVQQKSNRIFSNSNINLNEEVEVNLKTCLEMKQLSHVLKKLRDLTDDKLETSLNDSELPNLDFRLKQCDHVVSQELFPTWATRDAILKQCQMELEEYKKKLDQNHLSVVSNDRVVVFDASSNLDPYKKRDLIKKTTASYSDYNSSKQWLEQQFGVEKIIKERSVVMLQNKCSENVDYMQEFLAFSGRRFR